MKDPLDGPAGDLTRRIRGEFIEMPGLRLTLLQAQRLWGLSHEDCERVLLALVDLKFLTCGTDGKFGRLTENPAGSTPLRMAKAGLDPSREKTSKTPRRYYT